MALRNNHTQIWVGLCSVSILYVFRRPCPRHPALAQQDTTRPNPGTRNSNTWCIYKKKVSEQNSTSYRDDVTVRSLRFPANPSADNMNKTPLARVSHHVQKQKPQASVENKIKKLHKLSDVYNTIHKKNDWGRAIAMLMLPPPPTQPITRAWSPTLQLSSSWCRQVIIRHLWLHPPP